ncbi:cob(I)yrinic acid a,c-diamide adenosyltransferase [Roseiconus lacunae]|uniref:Corrinoid adenosyltransferase n=1 Tax=Roseiconus lacunae TaxID=2605694 RepID=A0ABT7PRJ5_9BACT|nr:cob(I)yrinic acid a,c-diamide adenosyltransferase [Roseiconus lacunae]MCD0458290.1 cob(I)yrinic acid a,c-diamide adenosyltransferase [Roseiconus lacunae]MDM4019101.1 cob(I)yrinic acid a,c-diamide adenosyltransferase [Roseiconus lacunae]WRQ52212.1 cob(I)yrinic acid a,c-diamide adenosyltransferase [Stieleria sp. HD01]
MKIYTRTGDAGSTGLFGGPRVCKDDVRIEAYGTIDELNASLGCVRSAGVASGNFDESLDQQLEHIQSELFSIGAELATPDPDKYELRVINNGHVARLESWIDEHETGLPPLKQFILPGGCHAASILHLARAICRRAERRVVTLAAVDGVIVSDAVIVYLNRLSDYLFVLSREANSQAGIEDVIWTRPESPA